MKKFLLFLLVELFLCSPVFSQLERGMWQFQNPPQWTFNSILTFRNGRIVNTMCDMNNVSDVRQAVGVYKQDGNNLVVVMNNVRYNYVVKWYNKDKMALIINGQMLIYSQCNSNQDFYMYNYCTQTGNNSYSAPAPNKKELCYTCGGSGSCKVCHLSGERRTCKACGGTGKCWHCKGSGIQ